MAKTAATTTPAFQQFKVEQMIGDERIVSRILPGSKKAGESVHHGHTFDTVVAGPKQLDVLYTLVNDDLGSRRTVTQTVLLAEIKKATS